MQFHEDTQATKFRIKAIYDGAIQINDTLYRHSILILSHDLISPWAPSFDLLTVSHFDLILQDMPQVLIIGTGKNHRFLNPEILETLHAHKIYPEIMNTNAACRTHIALQSEGRKVATGLIIE